MPTSKRSGTALPLVECVERLTTAGYLVLGPDNQADAATLLGVLAFGDEQPNVRQRAIDLLAAWPDELLDSGRV